MGIDQTAAGLGHQQLIDEGKGRAPCNFAADAGEMGGRHIKARGIVGHAQLGVESLRQERRKAREELRRFARLFDLGAQSVGGIAVTLAGNESFTLKHR